MSIELLPLSKICSRCDLEKQLTAFPRETKRPDGRHRWCLECNRAYHKKRNKDPRIKRANRKRNKKYNAANKEQRKLYMLQWQHGLDEERYLALLKKQNNKCAICGEKTKLVVDHDHSCCGYKERGCGKCIRGLLCDNCNKRLGKYESDPHFFKVAAPEYLKRWKQ